MKSKRTHTKKYRNGKSVTFVKLQPGERAVILRPHQHFLVLNNQWHFKIARLECVVSVDALIEGSQVTWCDVGQKWVESWESWESPAGLVIAGES